MPYLRAASTDCREILRHDWKYVDLDNVGLKMWGASPNFFGQLFFFLHLGAKSPSSLDRSL